MLNVYISFGRLMGIRKRVQTTVNCLALPRTHTHSQTHTERLFGSEQQPPGSSHSNDNNNGDGSIIGRIEQ